METGETTTKLAAGADPPAAPAPAAQPPADDMSLALQPQDRVAPPLARDEKRHERDKTRRRKRGASGREFIVFFDGLLSFLMVLALGMGVLAAWFNSRFLAPATVNEDRTILIPPRAGATDIAEILKREGLIEDTTIFRVAAYIDRTKGDLKAGEYRIPKGSTMRDIIDILRSGQSIQYSVTIPEGLTSFQIVQRLREVDVLSGEIRLVPPEGTLLPDTYRVTRGTSREAILQLMQRSQKRLVEEVWKRRTPNLPLKSPEELVILASIVEKETGKASERQRIAGVFVNRLNKRIRLQSDPTTIYGIVGGQGGLGRGLTRFDLDRATPYNTYVIPALPPTPIANPGRDAIEASGTPLASKELYFVADGTGGHAFSETLDQHQKAVARWRVVEKARGDQGPDEAPDTRPAPVQQPGLPVRQAPRRPAANLSQPAPAVVR